MSGQLEQITLLLGELGTKDKWQELFPWIYLRSIETIWRDTIQRDGNKPDKQTRQTNQLRHELAVRISIVS